jgi:DNA primase
MFAHHTYPIVIVEGFFDCIKLWQHGLRRVVAIMGSTLSPAQEAFLHKHAAPQSRVIVMFDEDDAGRAGREDIVRRLAKRLFVKAHIFDEESQQPENLTADHARQLLESLKAQAAKLD